MTTAPKEAILTRIRALGYSEVDAGGNCRAMSKKITNRHGDVYEVLVGDSHGALPVDDDDIAISIRDSATGDEVLDYEFAAPFAPDLTISQLSMIEAWVWDQKKREPAAPKTQTLARFTMSNAVEFGKGMSMVAECVASDLVACFASGQKHVLDLKRPLIVTVEREIATGRLLLDVIPAE